MYNPQQWVVEVGKEGYDSGPDLFKFLKDCRIRLDETTCIILSETKFGKLYKTSDRHEYVNVAGLTPRMFGHTGEILKAIFFNRVEKEYNRVHPDVGFFFQLNHCNPKEKGPLYLGMSGLRHPHTGVEYIFSLKVNENEVPIIQSVPMNYGTQIGIDDTFLFGVPRRR